MSLCTEQTGWEKRLFQRRIILVDDHRDKGEQTDDNRGKRRAGDPGVECTAPADADNEKRASCNEKRETDPVEFAEELAFAFPMLGLLDFEGWRVVEDPEHCEIDGLKSDHHVVADAPVSGFFDDNPADQGH